MTLARATLAGVLSGNAEKRYTQSNVPVTVMPLLVYGPPRRGSDSPEQYPVKVVCWRQLAEQTAGLQQGQTVLVEGRLQLGSQSTHEGQNRKYFELDASQVLLLPALPQAVSDLAPPPPTMAPQQPVYQAAAPQPQQAFAPAATTPAQPVGAPAGASNLSDLTPEDFLEDDIPF